MKRILRIAFVASITIILAILIFMPATQKNIEENRPKITASLFVGYDIARSLVKDTPIEPQLLLSPGTDLHSYEPSPQDIIKIKNSDIFIYNGGESEVWLDDIISEIDTGKTTIIRMMDYVDLLKEEDEDEDEYDEHVWTSPQNEQKIYSKITSIIIQKWPKYADIFQRNFEAQNQALSELDQAFKDLAKTKSGTIIMADRFPLRYFVEAYGFDYYAAFPGCAEQTEANLKIISELIDAVEKSPTKIIFHIELSNQAVAKTIQDATGAKILEFHSMHNISQADFDSGKTYVDFMRQNYQNLSEALHETPVR